MLTVSKFVDKDDPTTFCGTMCYFMDPTRFGYNYHTQKFGKYTFLLDLYNSHGVFSIE